LTTAKGKETIGTWRVLDHDGNNVAYAIFNRASNGNGGYSGYMLTVATSYWASYKHAHGGDTDIENLNIRGERQCARQQRDLKL
jgi:hypothetical protein